jgi:hypothetical protein
MDRERGIDANYLDPHISCWPCNWMMQDYDEAVVTYAVATGAMPLHERRRGWLAYQAALVNNQRAKDLRNPKFRELPNWTGLKEELSVKLTEADLRRRGIPEVDELTGQRYCDCPMLQCPLRLSLDRVDSAAPHILSNLQPLLACTNRFKGAMPDQDFELLIAAFREHNKVLIGTDPPELTPAPTVKKCSGKCGEWRPLTQFNNHTIGHEGLNNRCKTCVLAVNAESRARSRGGHATPKEGERVS